MPGILDSEPLITSNIRPRQQTYYLVTKETISTIKEKSIVSDILMLITSLLFGAFFSVLIALRSSKSIPEDMITSLTTYKEVFLGFGVVFLIMTVITIAQGNSAIKSIMATDNTIKANDGNEEAE